MNQNQQTRTKKKAKSNGDHDGNDKTSNAAGKLTFLVSVTDPDKKGEHDTFSITITDSNGNIVYQNSGTVKGHIEIHNGSDSHDKDKSSGDKDDKSDSGGSHNSDNNNKK